jgi:hypothetical protein
MLELLPAESLLGSVFLSGSATVDIVSLAPLSRIALYLYMPIDIAKSSSEEHSPPLF